MGKKASISNVVRAQIVTLFKEGYTERAIATKVGRSKNAVHNAVQKLL